MGSNPTLSASPPDAPSRGRRRLGHRPHASPWLLSLLALGACSPDAAVERIEGRAMGTTFEVVVARPPPGLRRADLERAAAAAFEETDRHLSGWNPDSEVARFNASSGPGWVAVSPLLHAALALALSVSRDSGGAFDVTVAPLVQAWGFGADGAGRTAAPTDAELARLRAATGYARLELREHPPALRKAVASLRVDLDGIAPGLAVDRIAARLEALGAADYLVELGGEVRARGRSPAGRPWRVAVEAPVAGERRAWALVELDGIGVSTSGDYRDFRRLAGRRISHTIDPRSGRPVEHGLASVTVLHRSAAVADAWATALMVLGPEEGLALAERMRLPALFIRRDPDGRLHETATPAFAAFRRPLERAL